MTMMLGFIVCLFLTLFVLPKLMKRVHKSVKGFPYLLVCVGLIATNALVTYHIYLATAGPY